MDFITIFNNNYIKTNNINDIILFDEIYKLYNITRKQLIQELKKHNISYKPFFKSTNPNNSSGCIIKYTKKIDIEQNHKSNNIYPDDIIIKFSPIMVKKYMIKIKKYTIKLNNCIELNTINKKQSYIIKINKYNKLLENNDIINKVSKYIYDKLIPITSIILSIYGKLYKSYDDELDNINFDNIKDDIILRPYYKKYLYLTNKKYKSQYDIILLNKITEYIMNNYDQAIINKSLVVQKNILHDINIDNVNTQDLINPTLDTLIKFIQYNDVCADFYFDVIYGKKSLKIYKSLITIIIHFTKYNDIIELYNNKKLPHNTLYFKLLKLCG